MKKVLITGAGSYVGTKVENWLKKYPEEFQVQSIDTLGDNWKTVDYSQYDTVFNVAGIAHVKAKKGEGPLYYMVNRDLIIEIAKLAKAAGVKQFIHMSSMIVYKEVKTLAGKVIKRDTEPVPNGFYGDSKLQGEIGLRELDCDTFKVCILRPPMIYGPGCRGNFPKLVWLATKTPVFPEWHNKRSMLYIDNLSEFVRQAILNDCRGIFFPQNAEYSDTVEVIRYYAQKYNHKIWITKAFNWAIKLFGNYVPPIGKMLSDSYYEMEMSEYDFNYNVVGLEESFCNITPKKTMR